mmetsp:Transcript_16308/g.25313  ORF Transcript_16308/g.25313 Transcript_16308/m.25313 type:complete len:515 (-) Transcript_16308:149-1693(-)|eukprot:CAMPEP_0184310706 /NCGR_PEP_ID=MMETSP1049-20130417/34037_1 /TAXON_ID=77928 /ORGANISM="Proteomonas sulcata, Strain CCMP704" /LENGTH=514 /DNA_ID=CAMNT_0026625273 /DNA_START=145 /DNA_END=1689 /DNA_ORIENTATION=+
MTGVSLAAEMENVQPAPAHGATEVVRGSEAPQKAIKRRRLTVLSDNKDASSGALVGQAPTPAAGKVQAAKAAALAQAKAMQPPAPKSLFTGVHWNKSKRKWRVRLKTHGRDTHIGYYSLEKDAALSYDRAVRENIPNYLQDPSVRLNFPTETEATMMVTKGKSKSRTAHSVVKVEAREFTTADATPSRRKFHTTGSVFEEINTDADEPAMSAAARCSEYCASNSLSPLLSTGGPVEPSASELPSPGTRCSSCSTPSMPFGPSMTQMNWVKSDVVHSKGLHAATTSGGIESLQRVVKHIEFESSREGSPASSVSSACEAAPMELDAVSALMALSDSPAKPEVVGSDGLEVVRKRKKVVKRKLHDHAEMIKFQQGMAHDMSPIMPFAHHPTSIPTGPCDETAFRTSDKEPEAAQRSHCDGASRSGSSSGSSHFAFSRKGQSFRGVTWDKMKKMWRVRVCLAGGGREHVGYFVDEAEGAKAYQIALEKRQRAAEQDAAKAPPADLFPASPEQHTAEG